MLGFKFNNKSINRMKAIEVLSWIVNESIEGEFLNIVDVPEEGDNEWNQNEEWWVNQFGMYPPCPIEDGRYLYYYQSTVCDTIYFNGQYHVPDAQIELPTEDGFDYIYLYRLED